MPNDASPLPPCPDAPTCVHVRRTYPLAPEALYRRAQHVLERLRPSECTLRPDERRIDAVFRVFLFYDDVAVAVTPAAAGATLHVRSASRVGSYDFGVNRRRAHRFLRTLEETL